MGVRILYLIFLFYQAFYEDGEKGIGKDAGGLY